MRSSTLLRCVLVAVVAAVAALLGPAAQSMPLPDGQRHATAATSAEQPAKATDAALGEGHGITAAELKRAAGPGAMEPPPGGWPVPTDRSYYLEASCQPYADAIRQGAGAWANLDETSNQDTPVECRDTYITDCGGGGNIVGCNWGQGQRIALYMGGVGDDALLAAHEFGHDWYGHSGHQCAGWDSPEHVMAPSICTFAPGSKESVRID